MYIFDILKLQICTVKNCQIYRSKYDGFTSVFMGFGDVPQQAILQVDIHLRCLLFHENGIFLNNNNKFHEKFHEKFLKLKWLKICFYKGFDHFFYEKSE